MPINILLAFYEAMTLTREGANETFFSCTPPLSWESSTASVKRGAGSTTQMKLFWSISCGGGGLPGQDFTGK